MRLYSTYELWYETDANELMFDIRLDEFSEMGLYLFGRQNYKDKLGMRKVLL